MRVLVSYFPLILKLHVHLDHIALHHYKFVLDMAHEENAGSIDFKVNFLPLESYV